MTACVALAVLLGVAFACRTFTVDDAFIIAGYARHLHASGVYSVDGTRVSDGVTGPLWLAPYWIGHALGVAPLACAKVCGVGAMLVAVWLALRRASRDEDVTVPVACAALCAVQADLAVWAVAGLETGAAALLVTACALTVTRQSMAPRDAWIAGACAVGLAWLRPETAPVVAMALLCLWWRDQARARVALALACVGAASVLAFRQQMFGHWWPLSAMAKPGALGIGVQYVVTGVGVSTGGVGAVLFGLGIWRGDASSRWLGAMTSVHALAVVLAGGDWMPGFRLLAPVLPLYAVVAARGLGALASPGLRWVALVLACSVPALSLALQLPEVRAADNARRTQAEPLARWLGAHACRVALVDAGYLVYASGVRVFDLAGVTDERVATLPGGHVDKNIPASWLLEHEVDTLVLRGHNQPEHLDLRRVAWMSRTERRLARAPEVQRAFALRRVVPYHAQYVYYVLQRDDAQRCSSR